MERGYPAGLRSQRSAGDFNDDSFSRALESAQRHQHDGFAAIYAGLNRATFATAKVEGASDPHRLTNSVFLQAFENIDRFAGDRPAFCVFLVSLTHFAVSDDRHRRDSREDLGEAATTADRASDAATEADLANQAMANQAMANQAMASLTSSQRTVLALRIFYGLTGPEVANALDLPIVEVRTIQAQAEARLQRIPSR